MRLVSRRKSKLELLTWDSVLIKLFRESEWHMSVPLFRCHVVRYSLLHDVNSSIA
jgi:hypothetical protein